MNVLSAYFKEPEADADGLFEDGRIHSKKQSQLIQSMAWWTTGTGIQGIVQGKPLLGSGVLIGSMFAQLYWAKPTFGWRRTIDIVWVQSMFWPHAYYAWYSPVRFTYYGIIGLGIASYGISWMCMVHRKTWLAAFLHMLLTACVNMALTLMYAHPLD